MKHPVKQALALLAAAAALWQPAQAQDIDPNLRDAMQVNHYLPGGDRHLFGAARGSVKNIDYRIHPFSATATGPVLPLMHERTGFDADLKYETHFSNHGYEVHAPFDNHNSRSEEKHYGGVTDGFTVYTLKYTGHEHHPTDGYDGPQGGGYPAPKGARDIYTYKISGTATKTKIIPPSNDSFVQRYWQDNAQVIPNGIQRHEEAGKLLTDFDNNKGLFGNTMQAIRGGLIAGTNFLTTGLNGASTAIGINTATDIGGEYGGYYAARSYFAARSLMGGQEGLASAVKSMQESAFAVQGLKSRASEWAKNNPATAETLKAAASVAETAALAAGRKIEIPNPFGRGKTNIAPPPSVPHPAHPDNNIGMNNANHNAELQQKISNNNGTPKTALSGESKTGTANTEWGQPYIGPKGGTATGTGIYDIGSRSEIYKRESGGYFTIDANGKQRSVNSPYAHGNTLNNEPTTIYRKVDENGNLQKYRISKNPDTRYTKDEVGKGNVIPIGKRPRNKAAEIERNLVERNPGPENKEPWAGKRKLGHPNYDPNYVPHHMRSKNSKKGK